MNFHVFIVAKKEKGGKEERKKERKIGRDIGDVRGKDYRGGGYCCIVFESLKLFAR